jgi:murein DD-endopeptidase MepM/ murein hydrolase activator NlpD
MRNRRSSFVATLAVVLGLSGIGAATSVSAADGDAAYYLPAPADTELVVSLGNGDFDGRSADQEYAFDFSAADGPERFPVVAARGGTVSSQRVRIKGGRCNKPLDGPRPSCWREVNYVLIDHGDGTSGLYLHLRRGDPLVQRGQVVSAGQAIGSAGNTGWTDDVRLVFQVQETPAWFDRGRGGWFLTESVPVAFADPDVVGQQSDGVPQTYDTVVSGNPGAAYEPFRFALRPDGLPASVPFEAGLKRDVSSAYEADSADGYGVTFAAPIEAITDTLDPGFIPGTEVRPLFGGTLAFAGCATGESASLGRTVAVELEVEGSSYLGLLGHLSHIEPRLLDLDPELPAPIIAPNDVVGHFGVLAPADDVPAIECPDADPTESDLFATILRDAAVTTEGDIVGGTPVSPEPLVGALAYEGFAWWHGSVVADEVIEEPGRPRARWNDKTPASGSHINFGDTIALRARVRDVTDIAQVRFRAYYPRWPQLEDSADLSSFDPATSWRELALCVPPWAADGIGNFCEWDGDANDAKVTFIWDPQQARAQASAPWLPRPEKAITRDMTECVPVSLAVEVIDGAGHVHSQVRELPRPSACDNRSAHGADGARVLYLDPLVPPRAPVRVTSPNWRLFKPGPGEDVDGGWVGWKDSANNESGYRVYARRVFFEEDCEIGKGPWVRIEDLPANTKRYQPKHNAIIRETPVTLPEAPGVLTGYELYVSAFNPAGESKRVHVGTFQKERGFFCDTGILEPPPDL